MDDFMTLIMRAQDMNTLAKTCDDHQQYARAPANAPRTTK
jgi:hypothetical protein